MMSEVKERKLTPQHKAAMAVGRKQAQIVNSYLTVIDSDKPKRGRKRTPESIQSRLDKIDTLLVDASMVARITLLSERENLVSELQKLQDNDKIAELESQFVEVARGFGEKNGISYALWKAFGVPSEVLDKAGVTR